MHPSTQRWAVTRLADLPPTPCPCGTAKRAFVEEPEGTASVHVVEIREDSETHHHRRLTEIYYVLEGEGHVELDGESVPVGPGTAVMIKPGCRHRAVGRLKILNLVVPRFDPEDEWTD